ncbi:hypothetical protein Godav_000793, partial [Gossypium davidsonii]|nr:hypothetical protein [Gossypium davidsonii]MBA0667719.1 hypothetical protein [Gossypium klotzschianum]
MRNGIMVLFYYILGYSCFKICANHYLKLLFDEYAKNTKSMYSFMARIFNVSDNDPIDSSLHQLNVYRIYFGGDCDESNDYK